MKTKVNLEAAAVILGAACVIGIVVALAAAGAKYYLGATIIVTCAIVAGLLSVILESYRLTKK